MYNIYTSGEIQGELHTDPEAESLLDMIAGPIFPVVELLDYYLNYGTVEPPPGLPSDVINQTIKDMTEEGIGRFH